MEEARERGYVYTSVTSPCNLCQRVLALYISQNQNYLVIDVMFGSKDWTMACITARNISVLLSMHIECLSDYVLECQC